MANEEILNIEENEPFEYTGNINLDERPVVLNEDGSISTEDSITFEENGKYINIPTIVGGKKISDEDAINSYYTTGEHLGIYESKEAAEKSAFAVHKRQEDKYTTSFYGSDLAPMVLDTTTNYLQYGSSRYKTEDYMRETGKVVPNYEGVYNSTIHDTNSILDDKDYDELADSKQTTPKVIWDTADVIKGIGDGARAAFANVYDVGGRAANQITEWVLYPWFRVYSRFVEGEELPKEAPQLSEEEMKNLNVFGSKALSERESYAGDIVGGISEFATGAALLQGFKPGMELKIGTLGIKTEKGLKTLRMLGDVVYGLAVEGVAFDENISNFNEFVSNTFGVSTGEFLKKNENDPYLVKKLKNMGDTAFTGFVLGATFKIGNKFFTQPAVEKAIKKAGEYTVKPVGKAVGRVVNPVADKILMKVDPIGSIARREMAEEVSEKATETIAEKTIKEGSKKVVKKITEHPKTLTDEEIDAVLKQAQKRGIIDPETLKNANKTVLEDAARSIVELEKTAKRMKSKVDTLVASLEAGEISEDKFSKEVMKLFSDVGNKAAREKTALSIPGYAEQLASQSETVKSFNRLVKYVGENQDRLDMRQVAMALQNLDSVEKLTSLLGVADAIVKRGKGVDFVNKFTQIMQNVYLASITGRVQDAVGSLANFSLQVLDAGTAGVVGSVKQGLRDVAARYGIANVKTNTNRIFLNEAYNMLSGMFDLAKETVKFNARKLKSKVMKTDFDELSPYSQARQQALASKASRFGKKYGEIRLFNSNAPIAELANKAFNHMGIWASEQVDDFIEAFAYRGHLKREVYHNVQVEGLIKGWTPEKIAREAKKRLTETVEHQFNPEDLIEYSKMGTKEGKMSATIKRAVDAAEDTTFRSELKTPVAKWIYKTVNDEHVKSYFRLLYPFQKVGLKIAVDDYLRDRSLATLGRARFWKDFMAGGRRQDEALAKLANGLLIQASLYDLYKSGKITGPEPTNRNKAKMYKAAGWKAFSIYNNETGEYEQSGNWMGPYEVVFKTITTLVSAIDDINERIDERSGDEWTNHLLELPTLFAESSLSTAFVGQMIDNIDRGDTLGIRNFFNSMSRFGIPAVQEVLDLFSDENKQTTLTKLDSFKSKWGLGETYDELDLFGEPLWADVRKYYVGPKTSTRRLDPVIEEMLNKRAYVQAPTANITITGGQIHLEPEEVYEWQSIMGEMKSKKEMEKLIKSIDYRNAVEYDNDKYGRKSKRALLVSKYNELKEMALKGLIKRNTNVRSKIERSDYVKTQTNKDEQFQEYVPSMR